MYPQRPRKPRKEEPNTRNEKMYTKEQNNLQNKFHNRNLQMWTQPLVEGAFLIFRLLKQFEFQA